MNVVFFLFLTIPVCFYLIKGTLCLPGIEKKRYFASDNQIVP